MTQRFLFSGRVQGVGFRFTVSRLAADLPVTGYVRNLRDGRVELVASGEQTVIDDLITAVQQRFQGNIESVASADVVEGEQFDTFEVRR